MLTTSSKANNAIKDRARFLLGVISSRGDGLRLKLTEGEVKSHFMLTGSISIDTFRVYVDDVNM